MSNLAPIPFARQHGAVRSGAASSELLQNLYAEISPAGAKSQVTLYGAPGLSLAKNLGDGPVRGLHFMGGDLYAVVGESLYVMGSALLPDLIGEVKGTAPVSMTDNGQHVLVVADVLAYAANRSEILNIPESNLVSASYQDGYAFSARRGTEQFVISNLDDMTSWSAIDFSSADTFPDNIVGMVSDHRELWIFGETTIEVWFNSGAAAFPFSRSGSGFMERGCISGASVAKADNRVFWLGDDLIVYTAGGYQPQRISTHAVEYLIGKQPSPQTARAFIYSQEGHTFYVLTFSSVTVVYDVTTGLWHTRKSHDKGRWRVGPYVRAWGKHYAGDFETGGLYEVDLDTYDENGAILRREVVAPPISNGGLGQIFDEVFLDMEMGVGLESGQGSSPEIMLDWSDDGGKTWSGELTRSLGQIGEYGNRAIWHHLGASRQRSLRFAISDPVRVAILGAFVRREVLAL